MMETPQRALLVAPHPNVSEFWCAGTVARWISEGATVRYVICTDGGRGTTDLTVSRAELSARRAQEQAEAAKSIGVHEISWLGWPDGYLEDTDDFRRDMVRQIRQFRPDVVICPEPYRKNLAWHRDNRIAGQVTLDAVFPCARDHLHFEELYRDEGLEPHKTGTVLFWGTETPNEYVGIDPSLDAKARAVKAGRSRVAGRTGDEIDGFIRQQGLEAAGDSGNDLGEAFRRINFRV